jgi:hypothetical protein
MLSNMYDANNGKIAPNKDRIKVFAAMAEAASYVDVRNHLSLGSLEYIPLDMSRLNN